MCEGCREKKIKLSMTTEEFIKKCKNIFGDNVYDYSMTIYCGYERKTKIKCVKHNIIMEKKAGQFIKGSRCRLCSEDDSRISYDEFLERARRIHGDKYQYDESSYIKSTGKIRIFCPIEGHGWFEQLGYRHVSMSSLSGCPKCGRNKVCENNKISFDEFLKLANEAHPGEGYSYNKDSYKSMTKKLQITCSKGHVFWQRGLKHIKEKQGCRACAGNFLSRERFIEECMIKHDGKYNYDKVIIDKGIKSKVIVTCLRHGDFIITAHHHLYGLVKCHKCVDEDLTYSNQDFIKLAIEKHGLGKYDYSKVNYILSGKHVIIVCPKHGEFKQVPNSHLNGAGCPECSESHMEKFMSLLLKSMKIDYIKEYSFKNLIGIGGGLLRFDFYIPKYGILIECDGRQHHTHIEKLHSKDQFNRLQQHDKMKNEYCDLHGYKLLRLQKGDFKNKMKIAKEKLDVMLKI